MRNPTLGRVGGIDCGVVTVKADNMFEDEIFFLIKMPLESAGISRVVAEEDNINLTAADVESFDVAMCGFGKTSERCGDGDEMAVREEKNDTSREQTLET